jgi:hypothetical protein
MEAQQPNRVADYQATASLQNQPNQPDIEKDLDAKSKQFYEGFKIKSQHFHFVDQLISEVSDGTHPTVSHIHGFYRSYFKL